VNEAMREIFVLIGNIMVSEIVENSEICCLLKYRRKLYLNSANLLAEKGVVRLYRVLWTLATSSQKQQNTINSCRLYVWTVFKISRGILSGNIK
jgi:hypothetical protein